MAKSNPGERYRTARTLTVDPRIRRVGFCYFEAALLCDWGIKNLRDDVPAVRVERLLIPLLVRMLDRFRPTILLVPDVRRGAVRRSRHVRDVITAIVKEATNRDIGVFFVSDAHVRSDFQRAVGGGRPNNYRIEQTIAKWFPELEPWLPRARRLWEPEGYAVPLFRAAAQWCAWHGVPPPESER